MLLRTRASTARSHYPGHRRLGRSQHPGGVSRRAFRPREPECKAAHIRHGTSSPAALTPWNETVRRLERLERIMRPVHRLRLRPAAPVWYARCRTVEAPAAPEISV